MSHRSERRPKSSVAPYVIRGVASGKSLRLIIAAVVAAAAMLGLSRLTFQAAINKYRSASS